jgi:undecaprenyl-diphosphatase
VLPTTVPAVLAAAVVVSRVYLGTHYLTDTVAGVLVGVLAFRLAGAVLARYERRTADRTRRPLRR